MCWRMLCTLTPGEGWLNHLSFIVAGFTALSKVPNGEKTVSALFNSMCVGRGNKQETIWGSKSDGRRLLDRCFGPPEPILPVKSGCTRQLRDFLTPVFGPRWASSSLQRKRLADMKVQSNSASRLWGPGSLPALIRMWTQSVYLGVLAKRKLRSVSLNWQESTLRETEQILADPFQAYCTVWSCLASCCYPGKRGVPESPLVCFAQILAIHFRLSFPRSCLPQHPAKRANNCCAPTLRLHGCTEE